MRYFFYLITTTIFFSSCGVKYKSVPYFTDVPADSIIQEQIKNQTVLKIQKNDVLAISVNSLNTEASAIFNMGISGAAQGVSQPAAVNQYLVDQNGFIQMPLIGSIEVLGLTTIQARTVIEGKLVNYLKEPIVSLRLANFRVSVLGDVARPGVYPVLNERVNLSEALSLAGDLNVTAVRNNVLLIRENGNTREYIRLNMQSKEILNTPYYYLQNNDVIYVQPGTAKYASVDASYRNVGIVLSSLSVIALIISRLL